MPVTNKESKRVAPTPSKIPLPKRLKTQSKAAPTANTNKKKQGNPPQTDAGRMDVLRSKLENSMSAFMEARKELEEVLSAGGSSEQGRPAAEVAAELKRELHRHRDLTMDPVLASSYVRLHLKENGDPKKTMSR